MADNHDIDRYEKVHLWIGTNFEPDIEYNKYFELDYSTEGDFDDPNYKTCDFCKDIGTKWYDQDFIGIIPRRDHEVNLDEILEDAAIDSSEWDRAKALCAKLGITKANAIFWYSDGALSLSKPIKDQYNKLKYIGLFEGE